MSDIQDSRFPDGEAESVVHESLTTFGPEVVEDVEAVTPGSAPKNKAAKATKKAGFDPVMAAIVGGLVIGGGGLAYFFLHKSHPVAPQEAAMAAPARSGAVKAPVVVASKTPIARAVEHASAATTQPVASKPLTLAAANTMPAPASAAVTMVASSASSASSASPASPASPAPGKAVDTPPTAASLPSTNALGIKVGAAASAPTQASASQASTADSSKPASSSSGASQDQKMQQMQAQIAALQSQLHEDQRSHEAQPTAPKLHDLGRVSHKAHVHYAPNIRHWTLLGVVDQTAVIRLPNGSVHNVHSGQWLGGVKVQTIDSGSVQTNRGSLNLQ